MGSMKKSLLDHLRNVVWAIFLVYIILLGIAFLFGKQIGYELSLLISIVIAGLVTIIFISIYLVDLLRIVITDAIENRRQIKIN